MARHPAKPPTRSTDPRPPAAGTPVPVPADAWDGLPPDVQRYIESLRERLSDLETENTDLREKLRAALAQDSSNSHRPSNVKRGQRTPAAPKMGAAALAAK